MRLTFRRVKRYEDASSVLRHLMYPLRWLAAMFVARPLIYLVFRRPTRLALERTVMVGLVNDDELLWEEAERSVYEQLERHIWLWQFIINLTWADELELRRMLFVMAAIELRNLGGELEIEVE